MYLLKQIPEDFIVREISTVISKETGRYIYVKITKRNRNTLDVVKEVARKLGIPEKQVGFAGSKDKNAITVQIFSITGASKERLQGLLLKDVTSEILGQGNAPISLGDLEGNTFEIVVRSIDQKPVSTIPFIPNYFDEQRFGENNAIIGKHLLKKEFKEALQLIQNPRCEKHLQQRQHDFIGALKLIPLRLLRLYVNAYQSYLWNETLARYLRKEGKEVKQIPYSVGMFVFVSNAEKFKDLYVPIIGFGGGDLINPEFKEIISSLLHEEGISYADFIIKQIPELTLEGELRRAFVEVKCTEFSTNSILSKEKRVENSGTQKEPTKSNQLSPPSLKSDGRFLYEDLKIGELEKDELNPGKKKVKLAFFLGKGSYATMVVRALFG